MARSVTRRIERNLTASAGFKSRPTDKASTRGTHQGQRSCETALKGRTHDGKRPLLITKKALAGRGPSTHEAAYASSMRGQWRSLEGTPIGFSRTSSELDSVRRDGHQHLGRLKQRRPTKRRRT